MERKEKIILIGKAGGNASKNAKNYKVSIPPNWIKTMGITEEKKKIEMTFDGEKIIIKKL